jgi:hypothetical protein
VADNRSRLGKLVPERTKRWADRVIAERDSPEPS